MERFTKVESEDVTTPEELIVRKVVQDVLMFVFHKQAVIEDKQSPELSFVPDITAELMRNLSLSVWIDSYRNEFIWKKYFDDNFGRMVTTPYLFAKYVYFACRILNKDISNAYESFCATLSLVTHFVLICWQKEREEFLNSCVELFCHYFYSRIGNNFEDHGGWKNFNDYLIKHHDYLQIHKQLMRDNKPENEIFMLIDRDHAQRTEPYIIGNTPFETLTQDRVECEAGAPEFAESVAPKIKCLCKKTLSKVLEDFKETNRKVEEHYRRTVGEATGGTDSKRSSLLEDRGAKAKVLEKAPLQKNQAAKAGGGKKPPMQKNKASGAKKSPLQKNQAVRDQASKSHSSSTGVQNNALKNTASTQTQKQDQSSKIAKAERAKVKLQSMLEDIPKMYGLIEYICKKNSKQTEKL